MRNKVNTWPPVEMVTHGRARLRSRDQDCRGSNGSSRDGSIEGEAKGVEFVEWWGYQEGCINTLSIWNTNSRVFEASGRKGGWYKACGSVLRSLRSPRKPNAPPVQTLPETNSTKENAKSCSSVSLCSRSLPSARWIAMGSSSACTRQAKLWDRRGESKWRNQNKSNTRSSLRRIRFVRCSIVLEIIQSQSLWFTNTLALERIELLETSSRILNLR